MLRPVLEVDLPRGSQSLRPELIKPRMPVVVLGWSAVVFSFYLLVLLFCIVLLCARSPLNLTSEPTVVVGKRELTQNICQN